MAKNKRSRVKTWAWRICLTLGLVLGLAMVFNEQIKLFIVNQMTQSTMKTVTKDSVKANQKKAASYDFDAVEALDLTTVSKAMMDGSKDAIGMLAVPSVNIHVPVMQGVSNAHMAVGAGTLKPNQQMGEGNYALAGHSVQTSGTILSELHSVQVGDLIYLTDMTKVYTYKAILRTRIDMSQVSVIDDVPGKKLITLITCETLTSSSKDRVYVRGELQSVTDATDKTIKVFEK
ncbi:class A sortase [Lacticaseibacillus daqingensis]|uniref:class A sortase n=1 Tax=Lacticaseibacillus daqingensis TaxID=2486014 RepID=UPI0013DD975C|nr:class A sortase [Lacticaseibacillus daqingensis]